MVEPHLIKRYANRKLYDATDRRYVALEDLAVLIRDGREVQVTDNETGEDITSATLIQVIHEQQKRKDVSLPGAVLHELIRTPADALSWLFASGKSVALQATTDPRLRALFPGRAQGEAKDAADGQGAAAASDAGTTSSAAPAADAPDPVGAAASLRARLAGALDDSVRQVVSGLGVVTQVELARLSGALEDLKAKLAAIEARRDPAGAKDASSATPGRVTPK